MQPAPGWPAAPPPPPVRRRDEPLPPAPVILAGIGSLVGVLPSLLVGGPAVYLVFGLVERLARAVPGSGEVVYSGPGQAIVTILAVLAALALPVLQGWGAVALFRRRGRQLLVWGCLPVTVLVAIGAGSALLSDDPGDAAILLVLLGPAAAPLFAVAPSVRRWLAERPFRVR
jgi:hypothetical protein